MRSGYLRKSPRGQLKSPPTPEAQLPSGSGRLDVRTSAVGFSTEFLTKIFQGRSYSDVSLLGRLHPLNTTWPEAGQMKLKVPSGETDPTLIVHPSSHRLCFQAAGATRLGRRWPPAPWTGPACRGLAGKIPGAEKTWTTTTIAENTYDGQEDVMPVSACSLVRWQCCHPSLLCSHVA